MTELEKIRYTKEFIDKLANGINPLDETLIPDGDLLNNVRISRCMFYVSGILEKVCEDMSAPVKKKRIKNADKEPFFVGADQAAKFQYDEGGLALGDIVKRLNELIDLDVMQRVRSGYISDWLASENLVTVTVAENAQAYKRVTEEGKAFGLKEEFRFGSNGMKYTIIVLDINAQKRIVEQINAIAEKYAPKGGLEFQGKAWAPEHDKTLVALFKDGLVAEEIAKELKRTTSAVRARLVKLGLINNRFDLI